MTKRSEEVLCMPDTLDGVVVEAAQDHRIERLLEKFESIRLSPENMAAAVDQAFMGLTIGISRELYIGKTGHRGKALRDRMSITTSPNRLTGRIFMPGRKCDPRPILSASGEREFLRPLIGVALNLVRHAHNHVDTASGLGEYSKEVQELKGSIVQGLAINSISCVSVGRSSLDSNQVQKLQVDFNNFIGIAPASGSKNNPSTPAYKHFESKVVELVEYCSRLG